MIPFGEGNRRQRSYEAVWSDKYETNGMKVQPGNERLECRYPKKRDCNGHERIQPGGKLNIKFEETGTRDLPTAMQTSPGLWRTLKRTLNSTWHLQLAVISCEIILCSGLHQVMLLLLVIPTLLLHLATDLRLRWCCLITRVTGGTLSLPLC